jgi:hypothetical protein
MNQFHERFSRGIFKQLQTVYARNFGKKIFVLTTGDRPKLAGMLFLSSFDVVPKLVRCRSCSQLSLIRISRSLIYIELDLDPTENVVQMTFGGALSSSLVIL